MPVRVPRRTLHVAERTLQAINILVREPPGLTPKELALRLGVSLSTAYNIINTLRLAGFAEIRERGLVSVGPELLELVEYLGEWHTLRDKPPPSELEQMAECVGQLTGARTYVAAWDRGDVEVIYIHGRRGIRELPGLRCGFRGAAHALALGKALLAERPEDEWPDYVRAERLPQFTPFTLSSVADLRQQLCEVTRRGVAFDHEEYALGGACIAIPIRSRPVPPSSLALGISLPVDRFRTEQDVLISTLLYFARELEEGVKKNL